MRSISISLFAALVATSALTSASGCQPERGPTIEGASPAEAARITADVSCGYFARCGVPQTTCSDSTDPNDDGDCETVFAPLSMDECLEEAEPLLDEAFGCAELDADLRAEIDDCLAAFETSECAADGEQPDDELGMPEGCVDALDALLECAGDDRTTEGGPGRPTEPEPDPDPEPNE